MSKNICPICGRSVEDSEMQILENGNPACQRCVEAEESHKDKEKDAKRV